MGAVPLHAPTEKDVNRTFLLIFARFTQGKLITSGWSFALRELSGASRTLSVHLLKAETTNSQFSLGRQLVT